MATGEYKGKKVKLDDPFRLPQGSSKKFGVYVKILIRVILLKLSMVIPICRSNVMIQND